MGAGYGDESPLSSSPSPHVSAPILIYPGVEGEREEARRRGRGRGGGEHEPSLINVGRSIKIDGKEPPEDP